MKWVIHCEGKIKNSLEPIQDYYLFTFEGHQNGDIEIEEILKKKKQN